MQPNPHAAISTDFSVKNSSCSLTIMQLFPPTFLSKTAQQKCPKNSHAAQPSCSYFHRLFYQKQLMQPNHHAAISISIKNFSTFLSHAPTRYAAISTTFLSKTAQQKSPPSVCSYFQRLFYQKQLMQPNHHAAISTDFSIKNSPTKIPSSCLGMQLFPTTFLSKTAQQKSPPSVCSYLFLG
jgi:hypothetical protein